MEMLKKREIKIQYDNPINISTGVSRKETAWKNREIMWSEFVQRCSETTRTAEYYQQYLKATKEIQDNIKDVGGYVGGFISRGRRKTENVVNRQLLTLDVDHGTDFLVWEDFMLLYGNSGLLYTTHKHSQSTPRFRLVIPLDRPVFCDEYQAIARRVAGDLGINDFDDTTFEPARLMYWPSTAKDGEFQFDYIDAPWLSADTVLNRYVDWRDSTSWPESDRSSGIIKREIKKQGDPLEKPGLIGAFCRKYTIHEAIEEFLQEEYEPCADPNRYTYKAGSTAAGLVLYEDKYAFSHHGTDPISGRLCNSFDLVRNHKYGLKDEDAKPDTPANRLPSYVAMTEFVGKLPAIRMLIAKEKVQEAYIDFDDIDLNDETWMEELEVDKKGNIQSTINNIYLIMENDPKLKGRIKMDDFRGNPIITSDLPWRSCEKGRERIIDADIAGLRQYIEKTYDINKTTKMEDALDLIIEKNRIHPVKDYLGSLAWDGTKRLESIFIDYLGAENNEYTQAVTRKLLVGAVARIYRPGCKFDYITVLVGPQGVGKSSIARLLGKEWFSDTLTELKGKEAYIQLQGVWIMELAELSGLKKAELETIKHFATKQNDEYRPPYGHFSINQPRQCVFFGTTNNKDFLRDPTGNRRFWPVDVMVETPTKRWQEITEDEIDQIWAEAVAIYKAGEDLYLSATLEKEAIKQQDAHTERDDRAGLIQEYLDTPLPKSWDQMSIPERRSYLSEDPEMREKSVMKRDRVCIAEIWCELFGADKKDLDIRTSKDLHNVLRKMEDWMLYDGKIKFKIYGVQKGYVRKN